MLGEKNILRKKVLVCLKGLKGAPSNTLGLFFGKKFFFNTHEKYMFYSFKIFSQKYAWNKKFIVGPQDLKTAA